MKKIIDSLCLSCKTKCKDRFEPDTFVYECDFYKRKDKDGNKRVNERKS